MLVFYPVLNSSDQNTDLGSVLLCTLYLCNVARVALIAYIGTLEMWDVRDKEVIKRQLPPGAVSGQAWDWEEERNYAWL